MRTVLLLCAVSSLWTAALGETADEACDTLLASTLLSQDCVAVNDACPDTCLTMLETTLDATCAGKYFTHSDTVDGVSVDVAKPWDTDKSLFLIMFQMTKHIWGDDACNEVIHDYQLSEINDCQEAFTNAAVDVVMGYYCGEEKSTTTTCAPECQETINKLESVCNPSGGPLGTITVDNENDVSETVTYSSETMAGVALIGPASCTYESTAPSSGAASLRSPLALALTVFGAIFLVLA